MVRLKYRIFNTNIYIRLNFTQNNIIYEYYINKDGFKS